MLMGSAIVVLAVRADVGDGGIVINEFMASNGATIADEDGDFRDWIELANLGDEPVDLEGYFLSDDDADPRQWELPSVQLEPGELLLVWASGKHRTDPGGELHTNFRISRDGEPLLLMEPDGETIADRVDPLVLPRDVSYGRDPSSRSTWCYFADPTPGAPNDTECLDRLTVDTPEPSRAAGFYDDPFDLRLAVPSDEPIYYTLDGSYPDPERNPEGTHRYEGPIRIEDRSDEPNRWTGYRTTVLPDWRPPAEPVQKATVVRARTRHSEELAATYFVGEDLRRPQLPVVSVASDPDHFFDHHTGIMVPGARYARWRQGSDYDPDYPHRWRPANYLRRGREWERPAEDDLDRRVVFSYCAAGTDVCELTQHAGVRIHGGVSRMRAQKSLRIYARNDYGNRVIDYPLFGDAGPEVHRRLLLRNSGSDFGRTMLMDAYIQSLAGHFEVDTQAYQPTAAFLNGEYWGILNLRERYDRHYLAQTHGVDPDQVVFLNEDYEIRTGIEGDEQPFVDLLAYLDENDPADPETLEHVAARVDLPSFIDYLVLQIFAGNSDWPHNNVRMWRFRADAGDEERHPEDGRWRYLAFDLDAVGANRLDVEFDNVVRVGDTDERREASNGVPFLFSRLIENDDFRTQVLQRFADHLNTSFHPDRTVARVDELEELLADELRRHAARWNQQWPPDRWHARLDELREFMTARPDVQRQHIIDFFDLEGTADLEVAVDPARGHVRVNTIELTPDTPWVDDPSHWRGIYFQDVPLNLEAIATEGYRFVGWEGVFDGLAGSEQVTVLLRDDLRVRPRFEPVG